MSSYRAYGRKNWRYRLSAFVLLLLLAFSAVGVFAGKLTDTTGGVSKPTAQSSQSARTGAKPASSLSGSPSSTSSQAMAPSNPDPKVPATPTPVPCNDPPCDSFLHLEPSGMLSTQNYGGTQGEQYGAFGTCATCTGYCLSTGNPNQCNPSTNSVEFGNYPDTVTTGDRFVLDLMLNSASHSNATAQQSYFHYDANLAYIGDTSAITSTCNLVSAVGGVLTP